MNEFLKWVLMIVGMLIAGFYIWQMVRVVSPETNLFQQVHFDRERPISS